MRTVLALVLLLAGTTACSGDDGGSSAPSVVVTTNILGDVVGHLLGDSVQLEVVMPPNADPHDFAASARQATTMREADALVVNGLGFEEGLVDTIESAEADGVPVITATDGADLLPFAGAEGDDPHVFTDPARMRQAAAHIAAEILERVPALDTAEVRESISGYLAELDALDADVEATLAPIPSDRRVLVTNHDVFGYFADRYRFEILGTVVPGGTTLAEPSASDLAALARLLRERDVPAVFADTSSPGRLAEALAAEGAAVSVVELYSESLGEPGSPGSTYLGMVRANAERIATALS